MSNNQQPVVETTRIRFSHKTKKILDGLNSFFSLLILSIGAVYLVSVGIPPEFVAMIVVAVGFATITSFLLIEKLFPFIKGLFKGGSKND